MRIADNNLTAYNLLLILVLTIIISILYLLLTMAAKARGGSMCAVSTCNNYSGKIKNEGIDISFHRYVLIKKILL